MTDPEMTDPGTTLADAIDAVLPAWVERSVDRVYRAQQKQAPPEAVTDAAKDAGLAAAADIGPKVRALLAADVDAQYTTPLSLVRQAVPYASAVLQQAGVPEMRRDAVDAAMFPEDLYGLTPANFGDVDPSLTDPGLVWGAAKAWTHRRRHQP